MNTIDVLLSSCALRTLTHDLVLTRVAGVFVLVLAGAASMGLDGVPGGAFGAVE